jgi:hypothetical protein
MQSSAALDHDAPRQFEDKEKYFGGEKMLHVDTFATHQWHCLPGSYWLKL